MALNWKDFSGSDYFKGLPEPDQGAARQRFFDDQVAPRFAPEQRESALAEFNRRTMTPATVAAPAQAPASIQRPQANVAARAAVAPPVAEQAAMPVRPVRPGQVRPAAAQPVIPRPPAGGAGFVEGLKDFGRGIARGVTEEIPAAVAGLVDYADTPTFDAAGKMAGDTGASDWARSTEEAAKARGENWQESEYGRQMRERDAFSVRGAAGEAGRMLPLSFGGGLAGAATGAAVGSVVPGLGTAAGAAAGYLAGSIASLPLFFGQQAKDTYDRVLEQTRLDNPDLTDEDAHDKAMAAGGLTGAVEAGGELVADLVGAKVFKLLPSGAKQGLVRAATKSFQGVRPMIADMLKVVGTEVGTELAQGTAQASIEKGYGVGEGATWENQKGVIMPTVLMSLVGGGAAVGMSARERYRTSKLLSNPSFTPQQRLGAAQNVARALHQQDPELAKLFFGEAQRQIAAGKPVIAEDDKFYRDLKPLSQREEDQRLAAGDEMPSEEARTAAFGEADVPRGTEIPPEAFAQPQGPEATDTLATDENGDIIIEDGGEPVAPGAPIEPPPPTDGQGGAAAPIPESAPGVAPPTEQPVAVAPPADQPITDAAAAAPRQEPSIAGAEQWDQAHRTNRSDEWFAGYAETVAQRNAEGARGSQYETHGMAKSATLTGAFRDLVSLLQNGLDPNRNGGRLYTAPLALAAGQASGAMGATPGGAAYADGPFQIVARRGVGEIRGPADIGGILVNEAVADTGVIESLRQQFPGLVVDRYSNISAFLDQMEAASSSASPAAAPAASAPAVSPPAQTPAPDAPLAPEARKQHMTAIGANLKVLRAEREAAKQAGDEALMAEVDDEIQATAVNFKRLANNQPPLPTPREQAAASAPPAAALPKNDGIDLADEQPVKALDDARMQDPDFRNWMEQAVGGLVSVKEGNLGLAVDPNFIKGESDRGDETRMIRAGSVNPPWFQEIAAAENVSVDGLRGIVKKAMTGAKLGVRQDRAVRKLMDAITDERIGELQDWGRGLGMSAEEVAGLHNDNPVAHMRALEAEVSARQKKAADAEVEQQWAEQDAVVAGKKAFTPDVVLGEDAPDVDGYDFSDQEAIEGHVYATAVGWGVPVAQLDELHAQAPDAESFLSSVRNAIREIRANEKIRSDQGEAGSVADIGGPGAPESGESAAAEAERLAALEQARAEAIPALEEYLGTDWRKDGERRARLAAASPDELVEEVYRDKMTGLLNKRAWNEDTTKAGFEKQGRRSKPYAIAYIDLDGLKFLNDQMGHSAGDELLANFGAAMKAAGIDGYHISGDEFGAIFENEADASEAMDRLQREVESSVVRGKSKDGRGITNTGIAFSYGLGGSANSADMAMQDNKKAREAQGLRTRGGMPSTAAYDEESVLQPYDQAAIDAKAAEDKARAKKDADAAAKQKADDERGDFVLAGSARPADQAAARGAQDMFSGGGEAPAAPKAKPSANTIFTEDAAEKARAVLRAKLGQVSTGIDPEIVQAGITLAGYHIEKGARSFSAYAKAMLADLGDAVRPYLKSWYVAISLDPRAAAFDGMDSYDAVKAVDVDAITSAPESDPINAAAHEAATSPQNDLPHPSEAQKDAGNYQKGHVTWNGLDITIENPAGSKRRPEWPTLAAHYGYLKRTEGADGDHIDVFINPDENRADTVFVIDQLNGGKAGAGFDEHKVMLGFKDKGAAIAAYKGNYTKGWHVGPVTEMSVDEFKAWLKDGDSTSPVAGAPANTGGPSYKPGQIIRANIDGKPEYVIVRNEWTDAERSRGEPISVRTQAMVARVVEIQESDVLHAGRTPEWAAEMEAIAAELEAIGNPLHATSIRKLISRSDFPADIDLQVAKDTLQKFKNPPPAPADEHAGKWFGSKDKALQYLAKKKIGPTHKIVQAGTRFEIQPIAPASAQAYAGETPATENNDAKRPVDQPGAGALAGKPAAAVRPAEEGGGTGTGSAGSSSGNAGGTGNAAGAGAGLASGVGNGAGAVPVSASGAASVGAGPAELDLFGVRGPAAAEAAASPGGRGDAPALVAPAQLSPDFVITDDVDLGGGGEKTKYRRNVDAIRLLNTLESEGRYATADEQRTLALYVGWGGLQGAFDPNNEKWAKEYAELKELMTPEEYAEAAQSTQYAHYTSKEIIGGIYGALERMGFTGGKVLEAGGGVGNFIGLMPDAMRTAGRFTLVERERIAAGIAKHLYPQQSVQKADFAAFGRGADGQYDVAAGNPPFSRTALSDQSGRKHLSGLRIHNYFIAKEIDLLRPGGILANVVSNGFLDSADSRARDYIASRAKFLGAIRLPNNAFSKNAGTEVTTDIVFFQKLPESEWGSRAAKKDAERWTTLGRMPSANGGEKIPTNIYFVNNPQMMLGNWGRFGSMYRADQPALVAKPGQNTALDLAARLLDLPANIYQPAAVTGTQNIVDAAVVALNNPTVSEGGFYLQDGKLFERLPDNAGQAYGRALTPASKWTEKTLLGKSGHDRLVALVNLRGTLRSLLAAEMADDQKAMDRLRAQLNTQYDAYAKDALLNDPGTTRYFGDDPDYPLLASLELDYKPGVGAAAAKKAGISPFKSSAKKAAIFTRRVVDHRKPVSKADSPQDALNISLAERGVIDADYIGKLLGKDPQSVLEELASGEKPLLFMDPATNEYVLRDEYLSGNVRRKLAQARQSGMMANARALEQVQPEDVGAGEISARIGSPWVPPTIYADFAKSILGAGTKAILQYVPFDSSFTGYIEAGSRVADTSTYGTKDYEASRLIYSMLNNREIKVTYTDSDGKTHTDKEGTELARDKAQEIREKFQDWLFADSDRAELLVRAYNDANNNYVTRVFDGSWLTFPGKVPDEIIKFRRHQRNFVARVMQTRTALADHVVGAGKTYSAIAAAMELKRTGLAKKPMIVVPNHLVKQWATDFYRLYPGANILTATKKDFERVNRRRFLGKIATGDWDAVIIAHSSFNFIKPDPAFEEEFTKAEVKELMDLIAQIEKADDSKENKRKVKQLQSQQERLENKLKSLREKPVDDMLDFEQLGVDQLFVDEAHLFKNLMFSTKMQNIRGLGDAKGSQRAFDMFIKVNETFRKNGRGQGVVFLTGTPVSNSLAEMYHMMRYLMPDQMREAKFWPFDAWANTYASIEETLKPKTSGNGYKTVTAFGAFTNTFELLKMFDQVSDTVTMDDIKSAYSEENGGAEFPLPKVKTGRRQPVAMEMSEAQSAYMEDIARRAEALEQRKGPPQKGEDNHLKVMGDARKAALDVRLVDTTVTEREKGARLDRAAGEIHARYTQFEAERGTQLVFSDLGTPIKSAKKELEKYQALQERITRAADPKVQQDAALGDDAAIDIMNDAEEAQAEIDEQGSDWLDGIKAALRGFSVYDDLKAALIERGIPEAQIAFIHDFNTDDQKAGLFRKVKDGTIRVLMGSTPKLGAGTNVQDRLVALHHIDIPWKPSDVEQREGRIIRQGNLLSMPKLADGTPNPDYIDGFEVEILAYVTKDTLDKNMWDIQERKLRGINQLRSRQISREIENSFDEMEMSASEMQAAATGNVDLLREIQLRNDIQKLERKKRGFDAQQADRDNRRKRAQQLIATLPADIALAEKADAYAKEYRDSLQKMQDEFTVTIDGTEYTDWKKAGLYLREQVDKTITDESGKEKPAPLNVTINGEKYTNRTKMTEAFTELRGDADPVIWEVDGTTLRRRNAIEKAIRQRVADALAEQTEQPIGRIGQYDVAIEGDGLEAVNVTMKAPGGIETGMNLSVPKVDPEDAARIAGTSIVRAAANHAIAAGEATWRKNLLKNAQRDLTELGEAGAKASWPDMAKLEAARAEHKEILSRLKASDEAKKAAREAESPAPDAAAQFSRSPATKPGHTEAALYDRLRTLFGPKFMDRLFQTGRFRVITGQDAANILGAADTDALKSGGAVRGFYHRGNGITYLVADSIPAGFTDAQLKGLMRHEIGVHALKAGRDSAGWQNILGEIDRLIDSGDKAVHAAFLRAGAAGTRDVDLLEEVAGYLVEDAPSASIVRRILAWLKDQVYKLTGLQLKLTDADVVAMAQAALRAAPRALSARASASMVAQPAYSAPAPVWVSALKQRIAEQGAKTRTGNDWSAWLQGNAAKLGIKKDEIEWSGITDYLAARGKDKLATSDIVQWLDANGVRVSEVERGQRDNWRQRLDLLETRGFANLSYREQEEVVQLRDRRERDDVSEIRRRLQAALEAEGFGIEFDGIEYDDAVTYLDEDGEAIQFDDLPPRLQAIVDRESQNELLAQMEAESSETKFDQYQLPGGFNYRELLLTLPTGKAPPTFEEFEAAYRKEHPGASEGSVHREHNRVVRESQESQFRNGHWEEPNVLAHVRFNERADADGRRVLFIEEIQSDWAQKGRKEGFVSGQLSDQPMKAIVNTSADQPYWEVRTESGVFVANVVDISPDSSTPEQAIASARELARARNTQRGTPSAPFVTDTKAWTALALKRMTRYAVDNGFEAIAWTTGGQQKDRYSLAKQLSTVEVDRGHNDYFKIDAYDKSGDQVIFGKTANEDTLPNLVGKELAEKMIAAEPGRHTFSGLDLEVGGEGMHAFYDGIVPQVARDLLKKIGGGGVESITFAPTGTTGLRGIPGVTPMQAFDQRGVEGAQPGFAITDRMREIAGRGLPMFSRRTVRQGRIRRTIDDLIAAAESQKDWRDWYKRHEDTLIDLFGNDADLFQKILSATSQIQTVPGNVTMALRAYEQYLSGAPFTGYLSGVIKNLDRIRNDEAIRGPKIANFQEANAGDEGAMAVDRHIAMLLFNTTTPNARQIAAAKDRMRTVAARMNWTPRQVQAALWAYNQVRKGTDPAKVRSYDTILETRADFIAALRSQYGRGEGGSIPAGGAAAARNQEGLGAQPAEVGGALLSRAPLTVDAADPSVPQTWYRGQTGERGDKGPFDATAIGAPSFTDSPLVASAYAQNPDAAGLYGMQGAPESAADNANVAPYTVRGRLFDIRSLQGGHGTQTGITPAAARKILDALGLDEVDAGIADQWSAKWGRGKDAYYDAAESDVPDSRRILAPHMIFDSATVHAALAEKGYAGAVFNGSMDEAQATDTSIPWGERVVHAELRAIDRQAIRSRISPDVLFSRAQNPVQGTMVPPAQPPAPPQQGTLNVQGGATGPGAQWTATPTTPLGAFADTMLYRYQDKQIDLKRTQQAIKAAGRQINEASDAYLKEELFHGRAATRSKEFLEDELDPLIADMRARGVSQEDLGRFLWARHAREANEHIANINPELPDGGSGMLTQEAQDYLDALTPQQQADFAALAARVDAITQTTRNALVNDKLISAQQRQDWESAYQHYVPLFRELEGNDTADLMTQGAGTGQGYSIKGAESKRRTGSQLPVADILGNIANARDKAIVRGEKARVGRALYALALNNKNPDFWRTAVTAPTIKTHDKNGMVIEIPDPMFKQRDNVVVVKVPTRKGNIVERAVVFNERDPRAARMARAIKNLDGQQLGEFLGATASVTRYFASINTQYNPIFGVVNLIRDVQTAMLNLSSTPLAGKQAAVAADMARIVAGAMKHGLRDFDGPWKAIAREFEEAGGMTGYRDMFRTGQERTEAIEKALDPNWWQKRPWGRALTADGYLKAPAELMVDKGVRPVMEWLSDYNQVLENATRLAAYKQARNSGLSKDASASIAKNLTVNFNRKGEMALQLGALYAFFNAATQGIARMGQTFAGPAGKYIVGGGVLAGVLQAMLLAAAGYDDEEPPQFVRERALILPTPWNKDRYVSIPMPLGFHVLPNFGRLIVEAMRTGDLMGKTASMMGIMADAFNPLGGSAPVAQILSPTATDPFVALGMNKDWTGKPIAREDFSNLHPTPGFTRARDAAGAPARWLAKALNRLSGGTDYTQGLISPTPDQIEYLAGQLTGGIGREAIKASTTATSIVTGDELPMHKVPLIGRFYGSTEGQAPQANKFYANLKKLNEHGATVKGLRADRRNAEVMEYLRDNPDARLFEAAGKAERKVSELRARRRALAERDASKAELKRVDDLITAQMVQLNDRMKALSK